MRVREFKQLAKVILPAKRSGWPWAKRKKKCEYDSKVLATGKKRKPRI